MSGHLDDLARTLATPMPRRRALRTIGTALAVAAIPALRPGRALGHSGRLQARAGTPVRCFVTIPYGTHEGGSYDPQYQKCCTGPNNDPVHPNLMSWVCPNDHSCGSAAGGFCPCPTKCKDGGCCPPSKGRCVNGTCTTGCGGVACPPGNKCCAPTQLMPKARCYDPETRCCTPVKGVLPKKPMTSIEWCPNRKQKENHEPKANGCGPEGGVLSPFIPNSFLRANFKPACDFHDICYETCRKSKSFCDQRFLKLMQNECEDIYGFGIRRQWCKTQATNYYLAVAKGGEDAYEAAQRKACDCC